MATKYQKLILLKGFDTMSMIGAKYIVAMREKENRKADISFLAISGKNISQIAKQLNISEEEVKQVALKIKKENPEVFKAMKLDI